MQNINKQQKITLQVSGIYKFNFWQPKQLNKYSILFSLARENNKIKTGSEIHAQPHKAYKQNIYKRKKTHQAKYNNYVNVSMQICFAAICVVLFLNMKKKSFLHKCKREWKYSLLSLAINKADILQPVSRLCLNKE